MVQTKWLGARDEADVLERLAPHDARIKASWAVQGGPLPVACPECKAPVGRGCVETVAEYAARERLYLA